MKARSESRRWVLLYVCVNVHNDHIGAIASPLADVTEAASCSSLCFSASLQTTKIRSRRCFIYFMPKLKLDGGDTVMRCAPPCLQRQRGSDSGCWYRAVKGKLRRFHIIFLDFFFFWSSNSDWETENHEIYRLWWRNYRIVKQRARTSRELRLVFRFRLTGSWQWRRRWLRWDGNEDEQVSKGAGTE